MYDIRQEIQELTKQATDLHREEKRMQLRSCALIEELEYLNASVTLGHTKESFAELVGLSPEVYWKRAQIGRTLARFPRVTDMIHAGDLKLSHVNLFAAKITEANEDLLLEKVRGKTTREIQFEVSTIRRDGSVVDREPEVELRLTLTQSAMDKLERAIEVLSVGGKSPTKAEALSVALEALLDKKDPKRKALRAKERLERKNAVHKTKDPDRRQEDVKELSNIGNSSPLPDRQKRDPLPMHVKHNVYLRDEGQCTYIGHDGQRCIERKMLEFDHIQMVCRGGSDGAQNLRLRCRYHNQAQARFDLGRSDLRRR